MPFGDTVQIPLRVGMLEEILCLGRAEGVTGRFP